METLLTTLYYLVMWGAVAPAFACLIGWLGIIVPAATNLVLVSYTPSHSWAKRAWTEFVLFPALTLILVTIITVSGAAALATASARR